MKKASLPPIRPRDRADQLVLLRKDKMARSTHAYVRGSTVKFYEWLERSDRIAIPDGPPVWICGDCHVGNLGPVGSADGGLEIQIRDLDQTVLGNPAHDLVRLGLSLAMAARGSALPGVTTARMLERMMGAYEAALAGFGSTRNDRKSLPKIVKEALRQAAGRSWRHLADERIEGAEPVIPLGKRFWPLQADEKAALIEMFGGENVRLLVTSLRSRDNAATTEVVDAAFWRKGCSSLGGTRYAVLLAITSGKSVTHCLMDVKEAVAAAAPRPPGVKMPRDNGERVVEGARHLSPFLGERMLPLRLLGKAVFLRELLPQDLKLEIEALTTEQAMDVAAYLSGVVGRAHARQLGGEDRRAWQKDLTASRPAGLDAPSWLWSSVVELVGIHESAYLEHCRRHALG